MAPLPALRQRWQSWWQARQPVADTHSTTQRNVYIVPTLAGLAFCGTLAVLSLGGLRVNEDNGAVIDGAGRDIPGLYAAGRTAIGVASSRYVSGLSLADCVFSGRRAGKAAALEDDKSLAGQTARQQAPAVESISS